MAPFCRGPEKPQGGSYQSAHIPPIEGPSASPQRAWCGGSIGDRRCYGNGVWTHGRQANTVAASSGAVPTSARGARPGAET
jgi:hypothetical protein